MRKIGLISDTHGMVRADVHRALRDVEVILHAGDVGDDDVLDELELIAPVVAVWGNTDARDNLRLRPAIERDVEGIRVHVSHGHELGRPTVERLLVAYPADVIVYGHTHQPLVARFDGRLVVNPGAAGPRRFDVMPSVARLTIGGGQVDVELVPLAADS